MIQMVFNIIGTALKKKNNVTLLAKQEEEVWWQGFAFVFGGRSSLVFIKSRQNHKDCIQQLKIELLRYVSDYGLENWMYQQDGYSIHTAQRVKKWFDDNNVQVLPWSAKSPVSLED